MRKRIFFGLAACLLAAVSTVRGATDKDYEQLKKEVEDLRKRLNASQPVGTSAVGRADALVDNKYGPNNTVTTKQGKLTIGGLLQVWYYSIQNDNVSWVDAQQASGGPGAGYASNEVADNDSFRIRRAELKFTMDIHENVQAVIMIDPAREATSFPGFPTNQVTSGQVFANAGFSVDPEDPGVGVALGNLKNEAVRNGTGTTNRSLQDAYINYHGVVPHHDFNIGQFKPHIGEEGIRSSANLDFVERALITQLGDVRDLGVQIHGTWWCDRFQYWLGAFDGAGTAFQQRQNRSDDNDEKDWVFSILLRPLWKDELWGSIEMGWGIKYGKGGEASDHTPAPDDGAVDGLNRKGTVHVTQFAYGSYHPGGPVRGWWIRGEWGQYRDRFAPGEMIGPTDDSAGVVVTDPAPFELQGWYVSTGYKIADSRWGDGCCNGGTFEKVVLHPMEFTFRYETMRNLLLPDINYSQRRMDVFATNVWTFGINYYIKGHNAKIQANYNWVNEDDKVDRADTDRQVREVRNDNFVVNFQVAW